jgi:hypothetical protein
MDDVPWTICPDADDRTQGKALVRSMHSWAIMMQARLLAVIIRLVLAAVHSALFPGCIVHCAYLFHRIIIKFVRERIVHTGTHRSWDITTKERRIPENVQGIPREI